MQGSQIKIDLDEVLAKNGSESARRLSMSISY